jgi:hypothetical protein
MGEAQSAAAADAGVTLPWWLAVVLAVVAGVAPLVTGWWVHRAASKQTQATKAIADDTHRRETSKSTREVIRYAADLVQSEDEQTWKLGMAMLDGLAQGIDLSPDDRALILRITGTITEQKVQLARKLEGETKRKPRFWVNRGGQRR